MTPERVQARLLARVVMGPNGCHVSEYSTGSHGYAQIGWYGEDGKTQMRLGHRVAWEARHGPIPDGLTVDHLCHNRRCVNVDHLRLLTNRENGQRNGRHGHADWPLGQCPNGHPDSERNRRGRCRTCSAASQRRYEQRQRVC